MIVKCLITLVLIVGRTFNDVILYSTNDVKNAFFVNRLVHVILALYNSAIVKKPNIVPIILLSDFVR